MYFSKHAILYTSVVVRISVKLLFLNWVVTRQAAYELIDAAGKSQQDRVKVAVVEVKHWLKVSARCLEKTGELHLAAKVRRHAAKFREAVELFNAAGGFCIVNLPTAVHTVPSCKPNFNLMHPTAALLAITDGELFFSGCWIGL